MISPSPNLQPDGEEEDKPPTRRVFIALTAILVGAILLAAAWRWTPLAEWLNVNELFDKLTALRGDWRAPVIMSGVYVIAGLFVFPVTLLIIITGVIFGPYLGVIYSLIGAELSAIVTYTIGHYLGHKPLRRISQHWVARISRRLAQQGLFTVITLRMLPVAPFTIINLVAGASHIRFRDYAIGTLIGMTPGTLALVLFSDQMIAAIRSPEMAQLATLAGIAIVIGIGAWLLSRWLLKHQRQM